MVEKSDINKRLYKLTIISLKIIPMLIALVYTINTVLCLIGIDISALSYIGGVSLLPLAFMYLCSYAFRFCEYHRMFLHYILVVNIISAIDFHFNLPISDVMFAIINSIVIAIFLFLILYLHQKETKNDRPDKTTAH